jgi:hypothetical protein
MTTIAFDGKTLAADRHVSADGARFRFMRKIHDVPGGFIAGCGDVGQVYKFIKWHLSGYKGDVPDLSNFGALVVIRGNVSMWDGDAEMPIEPGQPLAIGSGTNWALAAMDFGKTAVEAVEYAATRCNGTGGGVDSVTINPPRRKPARKG